MALDSLQGVGGAALAVAPFTGPAAPFVALGGGLASLFGGGNGNGQATPGVINPVTGIGVVCSKQDEVDRTRALANSDISWFQGRYGSAIAVDPSASYIPFPKPTTADQIKANFYSYLARPNPGQCPSMTEVARAWLAQNLPAISGGAGRDGAPVVTRPPAPVGAAPAGSGRGETPMPMGGPVAPRANGGAGINGNTILLLILGFMLLGG